LGKYSNEILMKGGQNRILYQKNKQNNLCEVEESIVFEPTHRDENTIAVKCCGSKVG
jgi:hypothetical protein